ncbi:preprotein translocase subunit YajC [Herbiconiux liangxiaofengii]|uniref:preprotein translocase subunit YajC n=1 Tax=Herbiconiux liangxiaofengii TaxID=3342795 RepID=UPI0035B9687B
MLVVLAVLVIFMFRNSRKRQRETQDLQSKVAVGAEVMTNFGLFGTILEMDDEENQVLLETTPGTVLKVHRQTVTRVVTPSPLTATDDELAVKTGDPEFGERLDDSTAASTVRPLDTDAPDSADKTDKKGDE